MNSMGNPEMGGIEAQPYSDRFPQHHIPFLYRLPYLPNNMKMIEKYEKTEPVFPRILPTIFTLTCMPLFSASVSIHILKSSHKQ
jgi:hypothetical protein